MTAAEIQRHFAVRGGDDHLRIAVEKFRAVGLTDADIRFRVESLLGLLGAAAPRQEPSVDARRPS